MSTARSDAARSGSVARRSRGNLFPHRRQSPSAKPSAASSSTPSSASPSRTARRAYDGNDPEVLGGWLEHYKRLLAGDLSKVREAENYIHAISQLRTPEAGAALLEIAERAPPERLADVVRALAWHGSAEALPFLRSLAEKTTDPKLRALVPEAIRFLE